jgi:hypothetical protein
MNGSIGLALNVLQPTVLNILKVAKLAAPDTRTKLDCHVSDLVFNGVNCQLFKPLFQRATFGLFIAKRGERLNETFYGLFALNPGRPIAHGRVTPAMAAGLTGRLWDMTEVVEMIDRAT